MGKWFWRTSRPALLLGTAFFFMVASGCGGSGATISGKVSYKGTPVRAGYVIFMDSGGQVYRAKIEDDATYTMVKVPPGTVKVAVQAGGQTAPPGPRGFRQGAPKDAKGPPKDVQIGEGLKFSSGEKDASGGDKLVPIPDDLQDPEKSGLTYTVVAGKQTHDIELK